MARVQRVIVQGRDRLARTGGSTDRIAAEIAVDERLGYESPRSWSVFEADTATLTERLKTATSGWSRVGVG